MSTDGGQIKRRTDGQGETNIPLNDFLKGEGGGINLEWIHDLLYENIFFLF